MDKNKLIKWVSLLILTGMSAWMVVSLGVTWGLDLQGGSSFTVQVDEADVRQKMVEADDAIASVEELKDSAVKATVKETREIAIEITRNRIDSLGTAEPEIYPQGDDRIVIRLPGVDPETRAEAKAQILRAAVLSFKLVHQDSGQWVSETFGAGQMPPGFKMGGQDNGGVFLIRDREAMADEELDRVFYERLKRFGDQHADFMLRGEKLKDGSTVYRPEYIERRPQMGGDRVADAHVVPDPMTSAPTISLEFDAEGKKEFGRVTEANVGRRLAVILDDKLYSAPNINEAIYGNASISGSFTMAEARKLSNVLKAGALPGRVQIVEERTVAPTLGQDSINNGLKAIIFGGVAVLVFMGLYYLVPGMIANFSLIFVLLLLPIGMVVASGFLGAATGSLQGGVSVCRP